MRQHHYVVTFVSSAVVSVAMSACIMELSICGHLCRSCMHAAMAAWLVGRAQQVPFRRNPTA